ncbi:MULTISPECIES: hypothetical protein [Pseudomonas]|uniref:Integrase n=1 Tax=Pseudomonas putida TaxID=303 RepID=A0ABD7BC73_PSEPU|nr:MULTISPECIES: hypothetical protein [Pseudomonas]PNA98410.1 hypothetical protein C1X74_11555 [Pseudomonas sp. GW460-5]PNB58868.1 hypothetical protein C1X73_12645 [Pseudomonas sp. FW305-130]QOC98158.1 hypothetical protein ID616_00030 [Pseudomonas putida]GJB77007.1 hypothetical protein KAM380_014720 [Aeromonas caviae]
MSKRKVFIKTDLTAPQVEHSHDTAGNVVILPEVIPPPITIVHFGRNPTNFRNFDFARWYGLGIDSITYACHRQIERFLNQLDGDYSAATVTAYCRGGIRYFLDYCLLRAVAFRRDLSLVDVNRDLIDGFLGHLAGSGVASTGQRSRYAQVKPVLLALGRRRLISLVEHGDTATFPRNPFPNNSRKVKGETPLSKRERQGFTEALRQAIKPLWAEAPFVTAELLAFALLVVALHTGRNATPLLEMGRDCLHPHPKDDNVFLVLWKRRSHSTSRVVLSASDAEHTLESTPVVRTSVERLIRRVMALTEPLDREAPDNLRGHVWLYRARRGRGYGEVTVLNSAMVARAANRLVARYSLFGRDGKPLRINVSRLRKTFADGIFELSEGNLAITAAALGNTLRVADRNYLAPSEHTCRQWRFMGEVLVQELLSQSIGATYKDTPMGRCGDPINGQFAPKREGATCMNFMNCLRCTHYAITSEDLHKLFSFYFRVLAERSRMNKHRWAREFAHIPRLIESYIVAEGLRRGLFKLEVVEAARERARTQPHPFWSVDLIDSLEVFA